MITLNSLQNYVQSEEALGCDEAEPGMFIYEPGAPYHGMKIYSIETASRHKIPYRFELVQNAFGKEHTITVTRKKETRVSYKEPAYEPVQRLSGEQLEQLTIVEDTYRKYGKHYREVLPVKAKPDEEKIQGILVILIHDDCSDTPLFAVSHEDEFVRSHKAYKDLTLFVRLQSIVPFSSQD